jgi:predicted acylesterase/phospholipase RssA
MTNTNASLYEAACLNLEVPLETALSATMSVPGVFAPVPWFDSTGNRHLFVDGGMRQRLPG